MQLDQIRKYERRALRDLHNEVREITPDDVVKLVLEVRKLRQENGQLKCEVDSLREQIQYFIPRRRVRRVYKQIKKILEQDGITDDLDVED